MCISVGMAMLQCACGGERVVLVLGFHFFETEPLAVFLPHVPSELTSSFWEFSCLGLSSHLRNTEVTDVDHHMWLHIGSGDLNACPHTFAAGIDPLSHLPAIWAHNL